MDHSHIVGSGPADDEGSREQAVLAVIYTTVGVAAALAPRLTGLVFGLDVAAAPAASYLMRTFGISLVGLGVVAQSARGEQRRRVMAAMAGVSAASAVATLAAPRPGIGTRARVTSTATTAALTLLSLRARGRPAVAGR